MADIGRSTLAHAVADPQTHHMHARLENWGAWQRSLPSDGPAMFPQQPMFRDVIDRYREMFAADPYDPDDAEHLESMIADGLTIRQGLCLILRYVIKVSSRRSANVMSIMGHPCSHTAYITWTDEAVEKLTAIDG